MLKALEDGAFVLPDSLKKPVKEPKPRSDSMDTATEMVSVNKSDAEVINFVNML